MIRKIAITINILGILCVLLPYLVVWLGLGSEGGSIALIGGNDNPTQLVLFADLRGQGVFLTSISGCIFVFNIFALWRSLRIKGH